MRCNMGGAVGWGWEERGFILDLRVCSPKQDAPPVERQSGEPLVQGQGGSCGFVGNNIEGEKIFVELGKSTMKKGWQKEWNPQRWKGAGQRQNSSKSQKPKEGQASM